MNIKYKTVHSIGDFISLPQRLSDPAMLYYARASTSTAVPAKKKELNKVLNIFYGIHATDYLANSEKGLITASKETEAGGISRTVYFKAWNPYLDSTLLGPNYNVYATMYNYFKYRGIKIKWIPNVRTSGVLHNTIQTLTFANTSTPQTISSVVQQHSMSTLGNTITEYQDGGPHAHYDNRGEENTGILFNSVENQYNVASATEIPVYQTLTPQYNKDLQYAPSLKMHVLFSKDDYTSLPLPAKPTDITEDSQLNDTVYKVKPYIKNMKTQNYKIYDMSKPFKFYCRPYCASKADEVTGYGVLSDAVDPATVLYSGDTILKKKTRLPRQVVNYESMVNLVNPSNTAEVNKWQARVSDPNFLNPIQFGYFFSVDGIRVDGYYNIINGILGTNSFDGCVPTYIEFISSLGHFEVTTYCSFNELNNISK